MSYSAIRKTTLPSTTPHILYPSTLSSIPLHPPSSHLYPSTISNIPAEQRPTRPFERLPPTTIPLHPLTYNLYSSTLSPTPYHLYLSPTPSTLLPITEQRPTRSFERLPSTSRDGRICLSPLLRHAQPPLPLLRSALLHDPPKPHQNFVWICVNC